MSRIAASGCDTNEACDAGISPIVAFARLAMYRFNAGGILLAQLPDAELREVLATYLPLGRPPSGATTSEAFSRKEEAGLLESGPDIVDAVVASGARYQQRFGYPFVVAAAGRPGADLLAELNELLEHDPTDELAVARTQLIHKCGLRLDALIDY